MAKQTINIGSAANDGTGDPLRTAFTKTNENFTELYNDMSSYSASDASDWANTAPTTVGDAIDRLAAAIKIINGTGA